MSVDIAVDRESTHMVARMTPRPLAVDHRQLTLAVYDRAGAHSLHARCMACDGTWTLERGEAFRCPHCRATLVEAQLAPAAVDAVDAGPHVG